LATLITEYAPDVIVVAQGGIAVSSAGLIAGKRLGIPTLSYIPMTHPESLFTASRFKAALREIVSRIYYRLPDEYITISKRMEDYLRGRGLKQQVTIVHNGIDLSAYRTIERESARARLGLSEKDHVFALIGRVEFWQKRYDLAVKAFAIAKQRVPNLKLLVVGDGPDLPALQDIVCAEGVEGEVVFAPWTDDMSTIYSAIDALVISSRYEGVPLVMLEAMYFRLPVIGSAVDGMMDILPQHWLFPSGDMHALAERLVEMAQEIDAATLDAHRTRIITEFSRPAFEAGFLTAIIAAVNRSNNNLAVFATKIKEWSADHDVH
jgi:glycosyltransferase involved in cell wall biosynthesis